MDVILIAVLILGAIGLISAVVLFFVSKKFTVEEDPRIAQVSEVLPQANCGGCGFPGCSGLASACVKAADCGSLAGLYCPAGGKETMERIADILGMNVETTSPKMAFVRCNGSCENRPRIIVYDGVKSCRIANATCSGDTACAYGCLGCGDCVEACQFDAISMSTATGLPVVDVNKCTACGACAKACPRNIIEIRNTTENKEAYVVECMNKDKGAVATKACAAACIGCMKCEKVCGFDAVHVEKNLAYIDPEKCQLCGECEKVCPKNVIAFYSTNGKIIKETPKNQPSKAAATIKTETAPSKEKSSKEPIIIKFDGALLPAVQYVLATPTDVDVPEKTNDSKTVVQAQEINHEAPLPAAMQILLGRK